MKELWQIDSSHSGIHFSVRHMVVAKVRGQFERWTGTVSAVDGNLDQATVDVVIDASSIQTGVADRDAHLKSADFFDVANYPELTFRSKQVKPVTDDHYVLVGELTIRGTTREVGLQVSSAGRVKDPWGNQRAGFSARGSIDRREFGLTWNAALETGGVVVGDRIEIEIEVEAVLQAQAQAA
jgi:polyisoprenoid-binding protein YceI